MNDHMMMLSHGDYIMFSNWMPAQSPHQWLPAINLSTTSSPPTTECCHSCNGVLIQCKPRALYFVWIEIKITDSHRHIYTKKLSIAPSFGQKYRGTCAWYECRKLNDMKKYMFRKATVRSIPISWEMRRWRIMWVPKEWRIARILFARRK